VRGQNPLYQNVKTGRRISANELLNQGVAKVTGLDQTIEKLGEEREDVAALFEREARRIHNKKKMRSLPTTTSFVQLERFEDGRVYFDVFDDYDDEYGEQSRGGFSLSLNEFKNKEFIEQLEGYLNSDSSS
jgi:hypothetical protein